MKTSQKQLCSKAMAPKYYWSLLKTKLNDEEVICIPPIFHDNLFVTDFSKKANLLYLFLQNSAQLLKITVLSPHKLLQLRSSIWQTLNSWKIILKESSINSILIKHMVMIWSAFACWKVQWRYSRTSFRNTKKMLKMWNISSWLEKRKHYEFFKKATNKT